MDNKVVLFNRPIWVVDKNVDIRPVVEVYGFVLNPEMFSGEVNKDAIERYLNYLCGVSKWEQAGNSVEGCFWESNIGDTCYDISDPFVEEYSKRARQQMYLTFLVFETNKILDKETDGVYEGEFITSRKLYNSIMEYGVIVE